MALGIYNRYKQAGDIVLQVGIEVGLPKVADPFTSNDAQYQRLITLLNTAGNGLLELYPWTRLINNFEILTIQNQVKYVLPPDFDAMIDQTLWRKGGLYPGYPTSPQVWQYLSNILSGITLTVMFRERNGELWIWPSVGAGIPISFEYRSRGWVGQGLGPNYSYRDNVLSFTDVVLHDPHLIERYLKLRFLEALGFDTQAAKDDFNIALEARTAKDNAAPTLNAGGVGIGIRWIDDKNAGQTNFGF
jgi:hypothetical protein